MQIVSILPYIGFGSSDFSPFREWLELCQLNLLSNRYTNSLRAGFSTARKTRPWVCQSVILIPFWNHEISSLREFPLVGNPCMGDFSWLASVFSVLSVLWHLVWWQDEKSIQHVKTCSNYLHRLLFRINAQKSRYKRRTLVTWKMAVETCVTEYTLVTYRGSSSSCLTIACLCFTSCGVSCRPVNTCRDVGTGIT